MGDAAAGAHVLLSQKLIEETVHAARVCVEGSEYLGEFHIAYTVTLSIPG